MKKPKIEAEEQSPRKIIRADKAPTTGYSLVVDGHFKSHHDTVESVPDASGAGLRRRDQDAIDDRMARAGVEHDPDPKGRASAKWEPVFPRDKREAFARRSRSNKES